MICEVGEYGEMGRNQTQKADPFAISELLFLNLMCFIWIVLLECLFIFLVFKSDKIALTRRQGNRGKHSPNSKIKERGN